MKKVLNLLFLVLLYGCMTWSHPMGYDQDKFKGDEIACKIDALEVYKEKTADSKQYMRHVRKMIADLARRYQEKAVYECLKAKGWEPFEELNNSEELNNKELECRDEAVAILKETTAGSADVSRSIRRDMLDLGFKRYKKTYNKCMERRQI